MAPSHGIQIVLDQRVLPREPAHEAKSDMRLVGCHRPLSTRRPPLVIC
jgi:hypothetical protein